MSPNYLQSKRYSLAPSNRQRGFLIPLSIFIVVVMGFLALALARTTTQTSLATAQELVSLQAFYAAESGAQMGMQTLFLNNTTRAGVDTACNGLNQNLGFPSVQGLNACSAQVGCELTNQNFTSYYTLTSTGTCGAGVIRAQRQIRVSAFMDQE